MVYYEVLLYQTEVDQGLQVPYHQPERMYSSWYGLVTHVQWWTDPVHKMERTHLASTHIVCIMEHWRWCSESSETDMR